MSKQEHLFPTKVVPGKPGSGNLFDEEFIYNDGPVTCLDLEFESDDARRAHFTEELRKKLLDPEFRKIEGFPIGEDEDILKLSDPPYYTACPNPWIADFIADWDGCHPEQCAGQHHRVFRAICFFSCQFAAGAVVCILDFLWMVCPGDLHVLLPWQALLQYPLPGGGVFQPAFKALPL